ncbi:MAG: hypothetical protein ABI164_08305 [Acidobacteriaceae bacterium]
MAKRENAEKMVWQTAEPPTAPDVRQLTEAVIMTLTEWNAAALDDLAQQASIWIDNPPATQSLAASAAQHRLLAALLQETERNLRMFRETSPCVDLQSKTGAYHSRWG